MKEKRSNAKKGTIGGWAAPCETIDYQKLMENARQLCDSLRVRLGELNHNPLQPGETELARRRTVRILTDMYYEQKSNLKLFERRSAPQKDEIEKAGEAEISAPPANSVCSKKKTVRTSLPNPLPPVKSAKRAERLLVSLTSQMPLQQRKQPVPPRLRQQDGRQGRR